MTDSGHSGLERPDNTCRSLVTPRILLFPLAVNTLEAIPPTHHNRLITITQHQVFPHRSRQARPPAPAYQTRPSRPSVLAARSVHKDVVITYLPFFQPQRRPLPAPHTFTILLHTHTTTSDTSTAYSTRTHRVHRIHSGVGASPTASTPKQQFQHRRVWLHRPQPGTIDLKSASLHLGTRTKLDISGRPLIHAAARELVYVPKPARTARTIPQQPIGHASVKVLKRREESV